MVVRRVREINRGGACSARSDDFVFVLRVRAPAYPPADFFYLVTSPSLWYLKWFGKLFKAARAVHARMMFLFLRSVCARPRIHQLILFYFVISAPLLYLGEFGKLFEAARAAHDQMMIMFLRCECARPRIHHLIFILGYLGSPMIFKRFLEIIRGSANSARSNNDFFCIARAGASVSTS